MTPRLYTVLGITFTLNPRHLRIFVISKADLGGSSLFLLNWSSQIGASCYDDKLLIIV
jgi:hypothetical protein